VTGAEDDELLPPPDEPPPEWPPETGALGGVAPLPALSPAPPVGADGDPDDDVPKGAAVTGRDATVVAGATVAAGAAATAGGAA
jgi:hypothetical protein